MGRRGRSATTSMEQPGWYGSQVGMAARLVWVGMVARLVWVGMVARLVWQPGWYGKTALLWSCDPLPNTLLQDPGGRYGTY